ncbi:hypothetical protein Lesp02_66660 [Lentzea sp. NBRC 105346]|uniref:DUF4407 domain-containing protein n=1 Tax=Lentzea sp. NBRC 105346 TaxID=3032205 RepID=UPI0024A48ECD|nr:DUF4407 domain-containing protein [Lentzea sp. NBRC 105346]GLZ34479.1 hypothetical protein Lesp02_66660 [Lentzea sp. NBRC 105346]
MTRTLQPDLEPSRPARPDSVLGRRARRVIGVREDVLDWVPEERPRYTRMGVIVVVTGVLSGLSMTVLLTRMTDIPVLLVPLVATLWGLVILALDSWLISSTHGQSRRKAMLYLPRLLISCLLGFVIAEPLVVMVFHPAINQQVQDNRAADLAAFESTWQRCNPASGEVVTEPGCADHRLSIEDSRAAFRSQRDNLAAQRTKMADDVNRDQATWNELEAKARAECRGEPGAETTGVPGEGPECTRNRQMADRFWQDKRLGERQAELAAVEGELRKLTEDVKQAEKSYGARIESEVRKKIDDWRSSRGTTGILEELTALGQLSSRSVPVLIGQWVLRLLLVLLDCLPVLTKWMGGATMYDLLLRDQLAAGRRMHARQLELDEEFGTVRARARHATNIAVHHEVVNEQEAARQRAKDEEIERRARRYRGDEPE